MRVNSKTGMSIFGKRREGEGRRREDEGDGESGENEKGEGGDTAPLHSHLTQDLDQKKKEKNLSSLGMF